jgi:hypothetical protein
MGVASPFGQAASWEVRAPRRAPRVLIEVAREIPGEKRLDVRDAPVVFGMPGCVRAERESEVAIEGRREGQKLVSRSDPWVSHAHVVESEQAADALTIGELALGAEKPATREQVAARSGCVAPGMSRSWQRTRARCLPSRGYLPRLVRRDERRGARAKENGPERAERVRTRVPRASSSRLRVRASGGGVRPATLCAE